MNYSFCKQNDLNNFIVMTNFEKQKAIFDEFIENTQDRFNLIIRDGVNIIFDKDYIMFDELITIRYSIRNLIPEMMFRDSIKTPSQFAMLRNIITNFDEITSILKEYMTLYLHMNDFTDKGLSTDEEYNLILNGIKDIQKNNPDALNGRTFFIKSETHKEKKYNIYLSIDIYGRAKKKDADISYQIMDVETSETTTINSYKIDKEDLAGDIAYQVSNHKCTHIQEL